MKFFKSFLTTVCFVLLIGSTSLFAQKMQAEDILAKHLDSIGSVKNRNSVNTRIILSNLKFKRQSSGVLEGKAVIASSKGGAIFGMTLDSNEYPLDKFSFDGKRVKVGYITPGNRSVLGGFILSYGELMKEGLLGGTLSTSWSLMDLDAKKSKLFYKGEGKIDGKETFVLGYSPKGGSDLDIKMYFDKQNFQHLRTEYNRVVAAQMGQTVDGSAKQAESRYRLVEDFSNFKNYGGLTLPSAYKIFYSERGQTRTAEYNWEFNVTDVSFNQPLGNNAFDIDAN